MYSFPYQSDPHLLSALLAMPVAHESMAPIAQLRGLSKRFPVRRTWAEILRHPFWQNYTSVVLEVTLSIRPGEFFGLLGPNGAGKTTLFKLLSTVLLPDQGTATVAGYDIVTQAQDVRRIVTPVIADERSLYWRLSALENLRLFAALYGMRGQAGHRRVREVLEIVGLADVGEKLVGAFSSGMKQRLLIGRALLSSPRMLLLDEPTRSLDPVAARAFRRFLREEIVDRQGCAVLLATHNAEEALDLCDRVAVLHKGRVVAMGTIGELVERWGEENYRLWAKPQAQPLLDSLARCGQIQELAADVNEDCEWILFKMQIPGGAARAAEILAAVVGAGIAVSRFERIELTLADLLDRVLAEASLA